MNINDILKEKGMTKYRLSVLSGVPHATLNNICNGKACIEKCSAETLYKLAQVLHVTIEDLIADSMKGVETMSKAIPFELFKSNVCHRVKDNGDIPFIIDTLQSREIFAYYERRWHPECLYLLAMLDYISRLNDVPLCNEYDDLRCSQLDRVIYPASILALCAAAKNDDAKRQAEAEAIPEFMRFNIVESEVRNVI